MTTVSVVIPAYEDADVLPRAIDSVLAQTLQSIELVVVDDGSAEDLGPVVRAYDDDRVAFVRHEENRGASAARNTGIDHASGRYVSFLDADDEWHPEKAERQVASLETRSDDWVAAYCGVETVFSGRSAPLVSALASAISRRPRTTGAEGGEELIADVLADRLHTSAGSTLLVRRDVAEAVGGFDESFERFQDPEFLVRVLREGMLAYVDAPLVRRHESGHPPADRVRAADEHYLETFADTVERLEAGGVDVTGAHHLVLARRYLAEGQFLTGLRYLSTARRPTVRQFPGLLNVMVSGLVHRLRTPIAHG